MIHGCREWQKSGLAPPAAVINATAAYLEAEDAISAWIEECCVCEPGTWGAANQLFASWKLWADQAGEFVGSAKRFGQNLETRGFTPQRKRDGRGYVGISSLSASTAYERGYEG